MPWTLTHLKEKGIILIQTSGRHQLSGLTDMVKMISEKFREYNCNKCLIDHRKAEIILEITPSYHRTKLYSEVGFDAETKAAILLKKIADEDRFFEDVCQNRGWNLRVFDDHEAAMSWLEE